MWRRLWPLWIAGAALQPVAAMAQQTAPSSRVSITSTTGVNWHTNNDDDSELNDDYGEGTERFNLSATRGRLSGQLRLDVSTFHDAPTSPDGMPAPELTDRYQNHYNLEKVSATWRTRNIDLRVGDTYVSFGRGLALSLRKVDELGVDTTLRGSKLTVDAGDLTITAVAGYTNVTNVDEASAKYIDDPYDAIAGVRAQYRVSSQAVLGMHTAAFAFRDPLGFVPPGETPQHYEDRWLAYGPTLDLPRITESLGIYLEAVGQLRMSADDEPANKGYGLYGTMTYRAGDVTALVEGKAYGDLEAPHPKLDASEFSTVQYTSAPTAERVLQQLEHPQRDVVGARLRVDWRSSLHLTTYANYGLYRDYEGFPELPDPDGPPEVGPATVHDPYAGIDLRWNEARSRAIAVAGWRATVGDATGELLRGDGHVELDLVQSLGRRWSLEAHLQHLERSKYHPPFIDETWREGSLQVGARWSPALAVGIVYDYITEALQPKTHYMSVTSEWRPTDSSVLRLTAGATRGGLRCVSGVCRQFPPFEGVKLSLTVRY